MSHENLIVLSKKQADVHGDDVESNRTASGVMAAQTKAVMRARSSDTAVMAHLLF